MPFFGIFLLSKNVAEFDFDSDLTVYGKLKLRKNKYLKK